MQNIPLFDLSARHRAVAEEVEAAVLEVLRSGRYVGGPVVARAEAALAALLGRAHGVGVASGTDALVLSLKALEIRSGDEVIVPAVTFFATAGAVLQLGAIPVVVDVLPDVPLLDPEAAAAAVTSRTRAVIPVHLFGLEAPHPELGVPVIDDSAQAAGGAPRGRGVASALSLYPTKIVCGAGDGGLVATDDVALAARIRMLGNHGMTSPNLHVEVGGHIGANSRLDAVTAATVLGSLSNLPQRMARRRAIAERYDQILGSGRFVPHDPGSPVSVYCALHPERDALAAALAERGIATGCYYPRPLSAQPCLPRTLTPNADRFCAQALALPCNADLSEAQVEAVVAALGDCA